MKNEKMKLGKKILVVVLIILVFLIIILARKMVIIKRLENRVSKYTNSTNYHAMQYEYKGKQLIIYDTYTKSNTTLSTLKYLTEKDTKTLVNYIIGETSHMYIESDGNKVAYLNGNNLPAPIEITSELGTHGIWNFIKMSLLSSIETEECNGKQCYKINIVDNENNKQIVYYDKDTGLKVRSLIIKSDNSEEQVIDSVIDYFYEFNNVNDDDLKEPDISQYEIRQ